jgi:hypothetical protein
MHSQTERCLNPRRQGCRRDGRLAVALLTKEVRDTVGELVRTTWAGPTRNQTRQAMTLIQRLRLIHRWSRKAEYRRSRTEGHSLDAHAPQHLVLDLKEIVRIEELVSSEQGVLNVVGAGMEIALPA